MDVVYMKHAIKLAKKGIANTHPNPRVGAVIVHHGKIVGQGWHLHAGQAHAEIHALNDAGTQALGATIYVTLEPCAAYGRTPPCTEALLKSGITRVVFASADPNPDMAGGSVFLKAKGLNVLGGVMADKADALNTAFFHYLKTSLPYVIAKAAISLDGKLATRLHDSQWITGAKARKHAHKIRAKSDAIIIGTGTLHDDNPSLTVRDAPLYGKHPLRVVIAKQTPTFFATCKLLNDEAPSRIYVYDDQNSHTARWRDAGMEIVKVLDLQAALTHLANDGCLQVMLEGGGTLHAAFLEHQYANELLLYQAPLLIGGKEAINLWHGCGSDTMSHVVRVKNIQRRTLGDDIMIRGKLLYTKHM